MPEIDETMPHDQQPVVPKLVVQHAQIVNYEHISTE